MANAYTIHDQEGTYFVTFTVHQWVDVFSRKAYADMLLENLYYCQQHKGLKIYAWVIMTNHCHLIVRSEGFELSDVIRDFKKHTSKKLIEAIENSETEGRKRWLLWLLKKGEVKWFWEEGYHGEEITSRLFFNTKVRYIHLNPVRAGIVEKEEEYLLSSCGDFYGTRKGLLELAPFQCGIINPFYQKFDITNVELKKVYGICPLVRATMPHRCTTKFPPNHSSLVCEE